MGIGVRRYSLAIALLLLQVPAWGATYYVDATGGSDGNTGTATNNAWKTVYKVNTLSFSAGDSILFKRGETWRETLIVPSSGMAGSPITFGAYESGAKPVINGANIVSTWSANASWQNVWQAALTTETHVVAFDDVPGTRVDNIASVTSDKKWNWTNNVLYIYSTSDPDTAFTTPGVEAGIRSSGIALNDKDYLTFSGLTVKYANFNNITHSSSTNDDITIDSCTVYYAAGSGISAYNGSNNWTISNNTIEGNGCGSDPTADNMYLAISGGTGWNIYGNTIVDSCGSGINTGISGNVYNNTVYGNSYGLEFSGSATNLDVYGNIVYSNTGFDAISLNGGDNIAVYRNLIYNNAQRGISVDAGSGHEIYYNIIYGHTQYGIYFAGGYGDNTPVYNNVSDNNIRGIQNDISTGLIIKNNILTNNSSYGYRSFGTETITNNDSYGNGTNYSPIADPTGTNGNISADPLFVSSSNFHLQSSSPAINAGVSVGLTLDYAGDPIVGLPDIGALEYKPFPNPPSSVRIIRIN